MRFYGDPVIWSDKDQLTAIQISLEMKNKEPYKLYLNQNCFIIEDVDTKRFNQVVGRSMIGHFKNNDLNYIDVIGNAESIYFLLDEKNKFVGVNRNKSSRIRINIKNGKIDIISFINSPVGKILPPAQMDGPESKFEHFNWKENQRPHSKMEIYHSK